MNQKSLDKLFNKDIRWTKIHELIKMKIPISVSDRDYYFKKLKPINQNTKPNMSKCDSWDLPNKKNKAKDYLNKVKPSKSPTITKGSPKRLRDVTKPLNIYRDIDEEFDKMWHKDFAEVKDVKGGLEYNCLDNQKYKDFIHKAIDKTNREWEKKLNELIESCGSKEFGYDYDLIAEKLIYLLKHKEKL